MNKFMAKYRKMSKEERLEVMDFEGQPCTWNVFWIEIAYHTAMGKRMLKQLKEQGKI